MLGNLSVGLDYPTLIRLYGFPKEYQQNTQNTYIK